jgi:hypothetical protein
MYRTTLVQETDLITGVIVEEKYLREGRLHRLAKEGPALMSRSRFTGKVIREQYFLDGKLHRKGGPADICWDGRNQFLTVEDYYQHGELHRVRGPAMIRRDEATGVVTLEVYARHGTPSRIPCNAGPARIERNWKSGKVTKLEYWADGIAIEEHFCKDEVTRHRPRTEGPAAIFRNVDGCVIREEFWEDGKHLEARWAPLPADPG